VSWKTYDESIELLARRFAYFPQAFRWRGRRYDVDAVERDWTPRLAPARRYFRVQCVAGRVELYHDLVANTWHLHRAHWLAEPARAATAGLRQVAFQD
jgi:hypothetical protein